MKTPQAPARNIAEIGKWPGTKSYRMSCSCTSRDHDVDIWIEAEPDCGVVSATFYTTAKSNYWKQYIRYYTEDDFHKFGYKAQRWANDWINRFTLSAKLIFKGYIQVETDHMLDEQQLADFIGVLQNSQAELDTWVQAQKAKGKQ